MRSDLAVKWLSLGNKIGTSKSKYALWLNVYHIWCTLAVPHPSVKRNEYWKEWPMCNRAIRVSSFLFFRGQDIHSFNTGTILYNWFIFWELSHPTQTATVLIYIYLCVVLGRGGGGEGDYTIRYTYRYQNDSCDYRRTGSDENHFNVSLTE